MEKMNEKELSFVAGGKLDAESKKGLIILSAALLPVVVALGYVAIWAYGRIYCKFEKSEHCKKLKCSEKCKCRRCTCA